ncbi:MAG: M48 family metallopeptidase [Verrucomicrobiota bacterium]
MKPFYILSLLVALLFFSGCETVPHTGRSSLQLVPESQLASSASLEFGKLKQQIPVSNDPKYTAMVQRVGERIAYAAGEDVKNANWEFVLFDDDSQINAFAMPGGKVAVYTGLFKVAQTDDELAVVIGHEVAHIAARHGGERVSQAILAAGGALALQIGAKDMSRTERELLLAAYGAGATVGVILPYSRFHENEADKLGLIYSARAGYDPRAAIGFWEKMAAQSSGGAPPEFLSTHPSGETRMERLKQFMPHALLEYERNRP